MADRPEVVVIGAGLIGLATAYAISNGGRGPRVTVIDKEQQVAAHQSGRNSGVIHSGIYYTPGSAKAQTCRRGRELLIDFVREHGIDHDLCGKVIVAVDQAERPALHAIARRGAANGVRATLMGAAALRVREPAVRGVEALHVPDAGIVDFPAIARRLAQLVVDQGGDVRLGAAATDVDEDPERVSVTTSDGRVVEADALVSCAGLHSDRLLTALTGQAPPVTIVPFRGEYHRLTPRARDLCRTLIYPVPDPRFPFLGVHLTRHISGEVLAGPNAVLALDREGYDWRTRSGTEMRSIAGNPGMRALARHHWRTGVGEMWRSLNRGAFARALQRMTPDLREIDLLPWRAGVRAQALHPDGSLADDFVVHQTDRGVHVLNAPSPGATASLAIGERLAGQVTALLGGVSVPGARTAQQGSSSG